LGRTSGQRTAEIFAGLRAELLPSPLTAALSRTSGRIAARLLMRLAKPELFNFVSIRLNGFTALVQQALPQNTVDATLVDLAAGFSPRGWQIAQAMPYLQVIEIDLPDVIAEKQKRLRQLSRVHAPLNLSWIAADLSKKSLSEVLGSQQVDVVAAEGLLPYFSLPDVTRIARNIYHILKPGGVFMADLGYLTPENTRQASKAIKFFNQQTKTRPGTVSSQDTARQLFFDAGYQQVALYTMPEIADLFNLQKPAPDVLYFMVASKTEAQF
jgi:O-methyltransferase involved in polyketide biosynthesis